LKTNRDVGRKQEDYISALLGGRPTKASGASTEIGDILNKNFIIESKFRNTKNITIKHDTWQKLCLEIPIGSLKIPLYIIGNMFKETFVVLRIEDFIKLYQKEK
jgi:hypothetical protein